jgi:hypothetical protein
MSLARAGLALTLGLSLGACTSPAASPTPAATAGHTPAPTATPTLVATPTQVPILAWPTDSAVALVPGTYSSSPPFDVPFTIDIRGQGWGSAHLHTEFFDFMNVTQIGVQPTRWVAFAHPETIGGSAPVAAEGLSPRAAAGLIAGLDNVVAGPISDVALFGIDGVLIDLTSSVTNVPLFGGPAGQFGMDSAYELRLTVLPHDTDADLLLVLLLAPPRELDAAWTEVQPILASVRL